MAIDKTQLEPSNAQASTNTASKSASLSTAVDGMPSSQDSASTSLTTITSTSTADSSQYPTCGRGSIPNPLVSAGLIPLELQDILVVPEQESTRKKSSKRIITKARVITEDEYLANLREQRRMKGSRKNKKSSRESKRENVKGRKTGRERMKKGRERA